MAGKPTPTPGLPKAGPRTNPGDRVTVVTWFGAERIAAQATVVSMTGGGGVEVELDGTSVRVWVTGANLEEPEAG